MQALVGSPYFPLSCDVQEATKRPQRRGPCERRPHAHGGRNVPHVDSLRGPLAPAGGVLSYCTWAAKARGVPIGRV